MQNNNRLTCMTKLLHHSQEKKSVSLVQIVGVALIMSFCIGGEWRGGVGDRTAKEHEVEPIQWKRHYAILHAVSCCIN